MTRHRSSPVLLIDPYTDGHHPDYLTATKHALEFHKIPVELIAPNMQKGEPIVSKRLFSRIQAELQKYPDSAAKIWLFADAFHHAFAHSSLLSKRDILVFHSSPFRARSGLSPWGVYARRMLHGWRPSRVDWAAAFRIVYSRTDETVRIDTLLKAGLILSHSYQATGDFAMRNIPAVYVPLPVERRTPFPKLYARSILQLPDEIPILGVIGQIRGEKGIEELLDAWPRINADQQFFLLVAGEDKLGILRYAGLPGLRIIARELTEEEVDLCMSAIDILVLPYTNSPGESGLIGLSCAHRVPICASDVGEIGRIVKDNGLGLVWSHPQWHTFQSLIASLVHDPRLRQEIINSEERYSNKLDWPHAPFIDAIVQYVHARSMNNAEIST